MSDDLHARLVQAAGDIEESTAPLDTVSAMRIRTVARRHRVQRRTTQSFAGVAAVAVLALVVTLGAELRTDPTPVPPAVTRTPSPPPAPTPSSSPTAAAAATPTGPPGRAADLSDTDVVAHLHAPRTGEVWQPRVAAPDFQAQIGSYDTAYRVGTRGDAQIFMTVSDPVDSSGADVTGVYERDASGVRLIACPSARSGDPCVGPSSVLDGVTRDESTFYDSLTLPGRVSLDNGFDLSTTATRRSMGTYGEPYGKVMDPGDDRSLQTVQDLGALALATVTWPSEVPGLTNLVYAFTTPLGSQVRVQSKDVPAGDFNAIRWDDGVVRRAVDGLGQDLDGHSPGAWVCEPASYAVDAGHDPSQWRRAGTSADDRPVYVPVQGGNSVSRSVREWNETNSWTVSEEDGTTLRGAAAGYPFATDEAFLAADALYAVLGPDGLWLLSMRDDARQAVYECD